jgi:hypothetical protein
MDEEDVGDMAGAAGAAGIAGVAEDHEVLALKSPLSWADRTAISSLRREDRRAEDSVLVVGF